MPPICFVDGARFTDADGFLRDLRAAVLAVPDIEEACELLLYLGRGAAAGGSTGRKRLCLVWLNSEVSRRRLRECTRSAARALGSRDVGGPTTRPPEVGFSALARWLGAFRDLELILL